MWSMDKTFDADHKLPILVWPFHDAPEQLRALSEHGGDEDWLVHVPLHFVGRMSTDYGPPTWVEAMGACDVSRHDLADGSIVFIGAHS